LNHSIALRCALRGESVLICRRHQLLQAPFFRIRLITQYRGGFSRAFERLAGG